MYHGHIVMQEISFVQQRYQECSASEVANALNETFHGGRHVRTEASVTKLPRFGVERKMAPEWTQQVLLTMTLIMCIICQSQTLLQMYCTHKSCLCDRRWTSLLSSERKGCLHVTWQRLCLFKARVCGHWGLATIVPQCSFTRV